MRLLRRLFSRSREEQRLDAELRFHVEQLTADYVAAGMAPAEARRRARLEFGGIGQVKEHCRDAWRGASLDTLAQDVRHAWRGLLRSPGFTAVAVLTLALGIGANTAIFAIVDALLLRPLPVRHPADLTFLVFPRAEGRAEPTFSGPEFRELRDRTRAVFSDLNAMALGGLLGPNGGRNSGPNGLTVDGTTRPAQALFVSGGLFQMLGIRPHLGRFVLPSEGGAPGGDPVVVLGYRYWKTRFHGDAGIVGRTALVNGRPVTIVGVAPQGFLGLTPIVEMQAYLPLGMMTVETGGHTAFLTDAGARNLLIVARLAPGVSIERANAALVPLGRQLVEEYPRPGVNAALQARPLRPPGLMNRPNPLRALAGLFLTLAGLVLALACLNLANLSLVRAAGRQREMAVRAALGGARARLVRHLLSETVLVALLGAAAGLIVARLALRAISSVTVAVDLPIVFQFPLDARVFLYALGLAVLAAALVGIGPALRASRGDVNRILHAGGRGSTGRGRRTRTVLVAAQVGGSLALLIVAGLFIRSLKIVERSDLGFDPTGVLNVRLDPGEVGYTTRQTSEFYDRVLARVRGLPGTQSASLATTVPLGDDAQEDEITIPGQVRQRGEHLIAQYDAVSPGYFRTLRIALIRGRDVLDSDTESSPRVALVNEAMAERFWHDADAIGRSFRRRGDPQHDIRIVGIVRNSRMLDPYSPYGPAFYVPIAQGGAAARTLQIRTAGPPESIAPEVLAVVRAVAPAVPVLGVRTMADAVANGDSGFFVFRLGAALTAAFGLLGLTLAVVGVYGVMSYATGQRTQEIGVRMALGAQPASILWMVARQGIAIVGPGLAAGVLVALAVGRLVGEFLVGVGPADPLTYAGVSVLLSCVAAAACYVPARRATRVDPLAAVRHE